MTSSRPVSIVILTYNNLGYTRPCLEAIENTTDNFEIVVVDNGSTDGTVEYLRTWEQAARHHIALLNQRNRGFAAGCNQGVAASHFGTVCLLNNDTLPFEGWLDAMLAVAEKGVGAVGAKLLLPDHTLQHCGIVLDYRDQPVPHFWPFHRFLFYPEEIEEANVLEEVPAVTAACLLTSKTVWSRVGGMDEGYLVANYEDVDFNLKVREAGLKVLYQPEARLIHYWGQTVSRAANEPDSAARHSQANYGRLMTKWFDKLSRGLGAV